MGTVTQKTDRLASCPRKPAAWRQMPPLLHAVCNVKKTGYMPILALLKTGADPDAVDEHGATALHEAVEQREPALYVLLVQAGADPALPDAGGTTPAMLFEDVFGMTCEEKFKGRHIDAGDFRIHKPCLGQENEDNPFAPAGDEANPVPALQQAIHNSDTDGIGPVLALLEDGANLDAADARGTTALHQAVFDERPDIYALLVQAGADPHIANGAGWSAAMFFKQKYGPFEQSYWGPKDNAD